MTWNDVLGLLAIASVVIPAILLAGYFTYDQRKQHKEKKS